MKPFTIHSKELPFVHKQWVVLLLFFRRLKIKQNLSKGKVNWNVEMRSLGLDIGR